MDFSSLAGSLFGIALWALVPGFIAKGKNRSFLAYFLLSFLLTPFITMIITLCLKKKIDQLDLSKRFQCKGCGFQSPVRLDVCPECHTSNGFYDRFAANAVPPERRFKCPHCGTEFARKEDGCPRCGVINSCIEQPVLEAMLPGPDVISNG